MDNLKTIISWTLNDYCKAQCEYCPVQIRGGGLPQEINEYLRVAQLLIDSYKVKQGRTIEWIFNGGEPLDMDYFPQMLKLCREHGDRVSLHTNGGRLWLDWWAIEPHVDNLILTFHFWQNPALIKYINDTFRAKGKGIQITAPIRHTNVQEDIDRVVALENELNVRIEKTILYKEADKTLGMFPYTYKDLQSIDFWNKTEAERKQILEQMEKRRIEEELEKERRLQELEKLKDMPPVYEPPVYEPPKDEPPPPEERTQLVEEKIYLVETTWDERYQDRYNAGPVFTGQMCNAGVERLSIGALGWVSGSSCNNFPLGNIWHQGWLPPQGPQKCGMISCINEDDQKITKFPLVEDLH